MRKTITSLGLVAVLMSACEEELYRPMVPTRDQLYIVDMEPDGTADWIINDRGVAIVVADGYQDRVYNGGRARMFTSKQREVASEIIRLQNELYCDLRLRELRESQGDSVRFGC